MLHSKGKREPGTFLCVCTQPANEPPNDSKDKTAVLSYCFPAKKKLLPVNGSAKELARSKLDDPVAII